MIITNPSSLFGRLPLGQCFSNSGARPSRGARLTSGNMLFYFLILIFFTVLSEAVALSLVECAQGAFALWCRGFVWTEHATLCTQYEYEV